MTAAAPEAENAASPEFNVRLGPEPLGDRAKALTADDDVIEDRDADERADLAQPAREIEILLARRGIARRMVVHDDGGGGGHAHERPEHLARMDLDAAHAAARDLDDLEQRVAHVDADHEEHLLREAREPRRDVIERRRRGG